MKKILIAVLGISALALSSCISHQNTQAAVLLTLMRTLTIMLRL